MAALPVSGVRTQRFGSLCAFSPGDIDSKILCLYFKLVYLYMSNWKERITTNPAQCGGRPCIRGMRIRVVDVLDLLAAGLTQEQVLEELPDLEPEDIEAALKYAGSKLDHPIIAA